MRMMLSISLLLLGLTRAAAAGPALAAATAEQRQLPAEAVLESVIEAVHQSTVSAETSGRVEAILVDVGDTVAAGAPILRLRATEQQAGLGAAQASVAEAQARFDEAGRELDRMQRTYASHAVAKAELDAAQAGYDAAKARLVAAQAGLAQAREQLGYTTINAPYGGVVLQRHVQLGEAVQPGTPLLTGFDPRQLRAVAEVPQRLIAAVRREASARVLGRDGQTLPATALTIFPYADASTHAFRVRIELAADIDGLYPGMLVKTAFRVGQLQRLVVPATALAQRGELSAVYVLAADGTPQLRQVRAGLRHDDVVEILAGLEAGERVALDPVAAAQQRISGGQAQ
ncbi:efflux RND transporter periplasmic adaptor subunit [Plasticicumulans acidivorans]|uniref:RND family efflux transporter MFP subunit n=1 Tax=Plasticicumulans acidivorans TaxID=886464 RepID=A0A317N191_9GAMM|nr:efflux RND transporter periplasmic adaptor subunit [Plasticicumulans acidivorans]PWV65894.1 RND family efflux transporter MFP subunit [Plasticicumulans acidivorans]